MKSYENEKEEIQSVDYEWREEWNFEYQWIKAVAKKKYKFKWYGELLIKF